MKHHYGVEAELVRGDGGVFDVEVNGDLVFSRKAEGRFPEVGEVEGRIGA